MRPSRFFAALPLIGVVACGEGRPETVPPPLPPEPDRIPPTLTAVVPEPDADNVWAAAPIRVTFSEPLDPKTIGSQAVVIRSSDGPLEATVTLSADGRELSAVLFSPQLHPTRLTATVANTLTDLAGNAFEGAIWSWDIPLWQRPGGEPAGSGPGPLRPAVALDESKNLVVAWQQGENGVSTVRASRVVDGRWQPIGRALNVLASAAAFAPRIAVGRDDRPIVVFQDTSDGSHVRVKRFLGERWEELGAGPVDSVGHRASNPALVLDADGRPVVAWIEDEARIQLRRWDDTSWQPAVAPFEGAGPVEDFDFAWSGAVPVLAATIGASGSTDVLVARWDAMSSSWLAVGAPLDRSIDHRTSRPSVAVSSDGAIAAAWQEHDGVSDNVYAARFDAARDAWALFTPALDIDFDASAVAPSLKLGKDGAPVVAWSEGEASRRRSFVARWTGTRWEVLGGSLDLDRARGSSSAVMVLDGASSPVVVWEEGASGGEPTFQVLAKRYNGSPELPFGLTERPRAPCSLPPDGAMEFPHTLTETGCFADVPRRTPAAGLVPYDVNSPLWSDGAAKRRFLVLPAGTTIGFADRAAWQFPVGTTLVKEFLAEREAGNPATLVPMETRFLVKRCEPGMCRASWQGYSYQWNDAGTDANLLENETDSLFKEWTLGDRVHKHTYPARDECNQCHALAAGGVLGFSTGQLNRNFDYGGAVDNQLRALAHAGLFGDGFALPSLEGLPRLPRPSDAAHSNDQRVRSYFHSNCSHCHRQDGRWPVIDFRFDTPLVAAGEPNANICNELVPGNAEGSKIYVKDSVRESNLPPGFTGKPMPPLATLLPDTRQLRDPQGSIDDMKTCP